MKQCNCKATSGAGPQTHLSTCPSYDPFNQPTERLDSEAAQSRTEGDECESCDDSGIYREGDEWAPCTECERGREFLACLKIAKAEAESRAAQRLRSEEATEQLRDSEWARSCSPSAPDLDSVEWAQMRLNALAAQLFEDPGASREGGK